MKLENGTGRHIPVLDGQAESRCEPATEEMLAIVLLGGVEVVSPPVATRGAIHGSRVITWPNVPLPSVKSPISLFFKWSAISLFG